MANLITVAQFKTYSSITATTWDTFLTDAVAEASKAVQKYCRKDFARAAYTEQYTTKSQQRTLQLRQYPVNSVTTIHDDPVRTFGADTLIAAADYYVDKEPGIIRFDLSLSRGNGNVKVVYNAGYDATSDFGDVPDDVKLATKKLVGAIFNKRRSDAQMGDSYGNESYTYDIVITKDVAALLEQYMSLAESS